MLLDPKTLTAIVPGCHGVEELSDTHFRAEVTLGVGPVTGRYKADITLSDLDPPKAVTLTGIVVGALGDGRGSGRITLATTDDGGTALSYDYDAEIGGKVAAIGGRLLDGATQDRDPPVLRRARPPHLRTAKARLVCMAVREARDEARSLRLYPRRDACRNACGADRGR